MIRTSITPKRQDISLTVPEEYVGKKVEILYYLVDELHEMPIEKNNMEQFWGMLSDESALELHKLTFQNRL